MLWCNQRAFVAEVIELIELLDANNLVRERICNILEQFLGSLLRNQDVGSVVGFLGSREAAESQSMICQNLYPGKPQFMGIKITKDRCMAQRWMPSHMWPASFVHHMQWPLHEFMRMCCEGFPHDACVRAFTVLLQ